MTSTSSAANAGTVFDIRRDLVTEIEIGWLDYLDETEPGWRDSTPQHRECPLPRRALELAAERILSNYDMKDVNE